MRDMRGGGVSSLMCFWAFLVIERVLAFIPSRATATVRRRPGFFTHPGQVGGPNRRWQIR